MPDLAAFVSSTSSSNSCESSTPLIAGSSDKLPVANMVLDVLTSPHRRSQPSPFAPLSPTYKKQVRDELGSWSALLRRHQFLLTVLVLLTFLCTIYLYFAVRLGADGSCSGMEGTEKALCQLNRAKSSLSHIGKLKFF